MQTGNIIVSPTSGMITRVHRGDIRIFLSAEDDHTIYAPMTGRITSLRLEEGRWNRKVFQAFKSKNGRLHVTIDNQVTFWIEVGLPRYAITDKIRFDYDVGDVVTAGNPVGEILFGSLSEIQIPLREFSLVSNIVKPKMALIGGQTPLALSKNVGHTISQKEYDLVKPFLKKIGEQPD